jgi:hypothetical protein
LKARFGLVSFDEREKLVTDGTHDGGIDAFYIEPKNKLIYVLQSKFRATAGNFTANNMSAEDLLKMEVSRILKGEKTSESGYQYNDKILKGLQKALKKLPDAGSYTTKVVLLGNSKNFSNGQLDKLVEGYQVEQFPHDRCFDELLFPVVNGTFFSDPNLSIEINLANLRGDTHLDYDVKAKSQKSNIKLLFVPTREMGRIMNTYQNSILKFNPRSFLELEKNSVNRGIEDSIKDKDSNEFALFNNGITIIAEQTSISSDTGKQGTAQIVLKNPQMVNGGQTAHTLGRIYADCVEGKTDFSVFKGKEVLLKVITFVGVKKSSDDEEKLELIGDISKASNSQTKVEESDRRSNDPIQVKLQKEFFQKFGLFYERKRGEFGHGLRAGYLDKTSLVNRERIVQISLACEYRIREARSHFRRFFEEDALSQLLKAKNVDRYVYGYEVLKALEARRKEKPLFKGDRYHTSQFGQALRYGTFAVIAACVNRGFSKNTSPDEIAEVILNQWKKFETSVEKKPKNTLYKDGSNFLFVNYYKGSTVNSDVEQYGFKV